MALEANAFIRLLIQFGGSHGLKAATVRENAALPGHKLMQPAEFFDQVFARPKGKMVGVGQYLLEAQCFNIF